MRLRVSIEPNGTDGYVATYATEGICGFELAQRSIVRMEGAPGLRQPGAPTSDDELASLARAARNVKVRKPLAGEPERVGRHLFDVLIGQDNRQLLRDAVAGSGGQTLEIALRWAANERTLHAVPWELMHDGRGFLTADRELSIAVTRVVAGSPDTRPEPIESPPHLLFVIGSDLQDPRIRAGAEFVGLLGRIREENRATELVVRVIEAATPTRLADAVAAFRPDIVNFISHGRIDGGRARLELRPDDARPESGFADSKRLLAALGAAGRLPRLVVVTGCESGTVPAAETSHADASDGVQREPDAHAAPLAAELVQGGIPIAVGMTGRVADRAVRLFTRQFGSVLVRGGALVDALAQARRAAFIDTEPPSESIDWALPSVFLSDGVPDGHALVDTTRGAAVVEFLRPFEFRDEPVFCGRRPVRERFDDLLERDNEIKLLVAYAVDDRPGMGESRVLDELGAHAVRAGHVPVALLTRGKSGVLTPTTTGDLAKVFELALARSRNAFQLPDRLDGVLLSELMDFANLDRSVLDDATRSTAVRLTRVRGAMGGVADFPVDLLRDALREDLAALIVDARARWPGVVNPQSMPVVLIDRVDRYGDALPALLQDVLGYRGLGTDDEPAPVVMSCVLPGDHQAVLGDARATPPSYARWLPITPFDLSSGEDLLATSWALLNPPRNPPTEEGKVVYTPALPDDDVWPVNARRLMREGLPGDLQTGRFYELAGMLADNHALNRDDDDDILRQWANR